MEKEIIEKDKVKVYCWNCGKELYIEKQNVFVGDLFCSNICRVEDYEKWLVANDLGITTTMEKGGANHTEYNSKT